MFNHAVSMPQRKLVLASTSPRRRELLELLQIPFEIIPSEADEQVDPGLTPSQIVETLSVRKADAVREQFKKLYSGEEAVVIGSDTVVVLDERIFGKPEDEQDALQMLRALQGRTHQVYTGIACVGAGDTNRYRTEPMSSDDPPESMLGHTVSKVTFRPMSDEEIRAYVKTGEPLDKAGAYGVQGVGSVFIEKIEGDFYSIMGLPLNLLYPMLLNFGISPFQTRAKKT